MTCGGVSRAYYAIAATWAVILVLAVALWRAAVLLPAWLLAVLTGPWMYSIWAPTWWSASLLCGGFICEYTAEPGGGWDNWLRALCEPACSV